jgi:hypothetical protein
MQSVLHSRTINHQILGKPRTQERQEKGTLNEQQALYCYFQLTLIQETYELSNILPPT